MGVLGVDLVKEVGNNTARSIWEELMIRIFAPARVADDDLPEQGQCVLPELHRRTLPHCCHSVTLGHIDRRLLERWMILQVATGEHCDSAPTMQADQSSRTPLWAVRSSATAAEISIRPAARSTSYNPANTERISGHHTSPNAPVAHPPKLVIPHSAGSRCIVKVERFAFCSVRRFCCREGRPSHGLSSARFEQRDWSSWDLAYTLRSDHSHLGCISRSGMRVTAAALDWPWSHAWSQR
jgi:hypothetical protein